MRTITFLLTFLITILILPVIGFSQAPPPPPGGFPEKHGLPINSQVPDIELITLDSLTIELDKLSNQFVLIDFWGTWCEPCLKDMPYLIQADKIFGDRLKIIGIAVDTKERVTNYLSKNELPWDHVISEFGSDLVETFNVMLYPTKILVSPSGKILNGATTQDEMDKLKGEDILKTLDKIIK